MDPCVKGRLSPSVFAWSQRKAAVEQVNRARALMENDKPEKILSKKQSAVMLPPGFSPLSLKDAPNELNGDGKKNYRNHPPDM